MLGVKKSEGAVFRSALDLVASKSQENEGCETEPGSLHVQVLRKYCGAAGMRFLGTRARIVNGNSERVNCRRR